MTILNENGVTVTATAVNIPGQPLRIADIVATRILVDTRRRALPLAISLTGVVLVVIGFARSSGAFWVPGIMLTVVGWLGWWAQDTRHRLYVQTQSKGEVEALVSTNLGFLERVAGAIEQARTAGSTQTTAPANTPEP